MTQDNTKGGLPALVYKGEVIHERHEMLSLTDMWRAAGGDGQKAPAKWRALPNAKAFTEHVALTVGKSDSDLFVTQNGGKVRGTWAHWHVAMAYAKYLDHDFHMWCNTVVRERMEGAPRFDHLIAEDLGRDARSAIGGIVKSVVPNLLTEALIVLLPGMVERQMALDPRVAALDYVSVRELLEEHGALQKGRGRLNRKVGRMLKGRALLSYPPIALRKCPHSGVWLYPRSFASAFMAEIGRAMVDTHNDFVRGQGRLHLVRAA